MANETIESYALSIRTMFDSVRKQYEWNQQIITDMEAAQNDLVHDAELSDEKSLEDGWQLYHALREARIKRRRAKEENEILLGLYEFLQTPTAQDFKHRMQDILGKSRKIEEIQENRTYTPRILEKSTIADAMASNPSFEAMLEEAQKDMPTYRKGKPCR